MMKRYNETQVVRNLLIRKEGFEPSIQLSLGVELQLKARSWRFCRRSSHEAYLMTLKQQQDRNITMLKAEFERKAGEVHKIFEKAMKTVSRSHSMHSDQNRAIASPTTNSSSINSSFCIYCFRRRISVLQLAEYVGCPCLSTSFMGRTGGNHKILLEAYVQPF